MVKTCRQINCHRDDFISLSGSYPKCCSYALKRGSPQNDTRIKMCTRMSGYRKRSLTKIGKNKIGLIDFACNNGLVSCIKLGKPGCCQIQLRS